LLGLEHRLEQVDPLEVFFVVRGILCLHVARTAGLQFASGDQAADEGIPCHHPEEICVVSGPDETLEMLEMVEDRMMQMPLVYWICRSL
jgi:hypothetical protein